MATYEITFSFEGYRTVEIEADSLDEAVEKATDIATETDCGELENIDMCQVLDNMCNVL